MFILVFFEFFFLRFSGVFSCDFRFVTFTQPFRDFLHGSVSPRRCESLAQVLSHFVVIWASTFDLKFESRVCSLPVSSLFLLLLWDFLLSGGKGTPAVEGSELCLPRQRAAAALEHPLGAWLVLSEHGWLRSYRSSRSAALVRPTEERVARQDRARPARLLGRLPPCLQHVSKLPAKEGSRFPHSPLWALFLISFYICLFPDHRLELTRIIARGCRACTFARPPRVL